MKPVSKLPTAASGLRLKTTQGTIATIPQNTKDDPTHIPNAKTPASTQDRINNDQCSIASHEQTKNMTKKASQGEESRIPERKAGCRTNRRNAPTPPAMAF